MPPKKRGPQDSTGAEPASKTQRQDDNGEGPSTRSEPEQANSSPSDSGSQNDQADQDDNKAPYDYMCMVIPQWADEDGLDDEEARAVHNKSASEHPEWKWVTMNETWLIMTEWHRRTDYCQPDNFDMYIYNDWFGYGVQELQENLLVRFHDELSKKQKSIEAMWAVIAGMLHWRLIESDNLLSHDDGEREGETWGLSGCAILTMLNELDRAGHLKPDSKFLDLALVMVMALKWSEDQEDHEPEDFEWRNNVVAYAKKGGIDLTTVPLDDAQDLVEGVDDAEIPARVKADQWDFKKKYKEFEAKHGTRKRANGKPTLGGTQYDITKMKSEERASYNFDKVDPLPSDIPEGAFLEIQRG